jgi:hypothetical protein
MGSHMAVRLSPLGSSSPLPPERFLVIVSVRGWVGPRANYIGNRIRYLIACSIVPQPTTLQRDPNINNNNDAHLCGLVVGVPDYRSRGPGFDFRRYQILCEVLGLERVPLSLVSKTDELLEWRNSGSGSRKPRLTAVGICCSGHATRSIRKSWH